MVLDELERDAGVQEMGGDRMSQAVTGVAAIEPGHVSVMNEQRLNLALPKRATPTREERGFRHLGPAGEMAAQQLRSGTEQRPLHPRPALEPLDNDSAALEVHIPLAEKRHLSHPKAVVVDQRKQRPVTRVSDRLEEGTELDLGEVAGQALGRPQGAGHEAEGVSG